MDLMSYATGGATRPDSFTGMTDPFQEALGELFAAAPPDVQSHLMVSSGYRSPERQQQLWDQALQKYGSPEVARKWVAPPGNSQHNHGNAADLKYLSPDAQKWARQNAPKFGLSFPLSNENWHIELATARGAKPNGLRAIPNTTPMVPPRDVGVPRTAGIRTAPARTIMGGRLQAPPVRQASIMTAPRSLVEETSRFAPRSPMMTAPRGAPVMRGAVVAAIPQQQPMRSAPVMVSSVSTPGRGYSTGNTAAERIYERGALGRSGAEYSSIG